MGKKSVVITGMGTLCPIGLTTTEFWRSCLAGKQAASYIPEQWLEYADYTSRYWAPLPEIDFSKLGISRIDSLRLDPVSKMSLIAAAQALEDASIAVRAIDRKDTLFELEGIDPERSGVFMGTGIGGVNTTAVSHTTHLFPRYRKDIQDILDTAELNSSVRQELHGVLKTMDSPVRYNPFAVSMIMSNSISANIGIRYQCKGSNTTVSIACASSTAALGQAYTAIQSGSLDLIISGGAEYKYDGTGCVFRAYDVAGTLAHDFPSPLEANRPFDKQRNGFLFSQGAAAVLILEEKQHAIQRGANIVAEIGGYAESFDGHSIMQPDPEGIQIERMIHSALSQAGIAANELDYINAHGTGTLANDETECRIIERIFGDRPVVNSTKSLVGHTIGASGALEAQVAALSIRD
ncbi:MAG: beta-ketoacyl-[acyl-carrier-protein] synthase family protein, partial [Proteobacteria bacterium]|nr:beta-ketoacyl-[acyl-carrier-protein] synthase family protein [Pseudomonadota bacterium]